MKNNLLKNWEVQRYGDHPHYEIWAKYAPNSPQRIASIEDHLPESQAIADLVGATPDLLNGCLAALAYLADPPSKFESNRKDAIKIIEAAVAKAKGDLSNG